MVALADVLGDPDLGLHVVVDARGGDALFWAATSELVDPSPFLDTGEVLLTTGLETVGWDSEWEVYVARLASVGVLGVGLGLDLTYDTSPAGLVEACRRHDLALFEVPRGTTFVAITRRVSELLHQEDQSAVRSALVRQRELTNAALAEDGVSAIVAVVARVGQAAAVVDAATGEILAQAGEHLDLLEPDAIESGIARIRGQGLRAAAAVQVARGHLTFYPLGVRGRPARYLIAGFVEPANSDQRGSVMTAVSLLSLAEERWRTRVVSERRVRSRAMELVSRGDVRTAAVLLDAAVEGPARLPRRGAALRARGSAAALENALDRLDGDRVLAGLVIGAEGELAAVASVSRIESATATLVGAGLRVGVGETVAAADFQRSFRTAGHAVELASSDVPLVSWETGVRKGVLTVLDADRLASFSDTWLAPLEALEEPELAETLRSFLTHHGSLLKVSAELGIHRNTVRNRVDRIEAVIGRSLADPQVRVDAWVALQARSVES